MRLYREKKRVKVLYFCFDIVDLLEELITSGLTVTVRNLDGTTAEIYADEHGYRTIANPIDVSTFGGKVKFHGLAEQYDLVLVNGYAETDYRYGLSIFKHRVMTSLKSFDNDGETGVKGPDGDAGAKGPLGDQGVIGDAGGIGSPGNKGGAGDVGAKGASGDQGVIGDAGATGAAGDKGGVGDAGAAGATGDKGAAGDAGAKGAAGDKGGVGDQGAKGEPGEGCLCCSEYGHPVPYYTCQPGGTEEYCQGVLADWEENGPPELCPLTISQVCDEEATCEHPDGHCFYYMACDGFGMMVYLFDYTTCGLRLCV